MAIVAMLVSFGSSACSQALHEPAADLARRSASEPWRVHCESGILYEGTPETAGHRQRPNWIWAEDAGGRPIELYGEVHNGFLFVNRIAVAGDDGLAPYTTRKALRSACAETLARMPGGRGRELGKVRAARDKEGINVAFVLPQARADASKVHGLVVFGDSLSDAGRLRQRLKVFPLPPYWLGRFSNGPVWTDYLEYESRLAIQNHAYGGASMGRHAHVHTANMLAMLREGGQFFLTGSIDVQVDDYLHRAKHTPEIRHPEEVVYVIWAGANDYLWKEPFSGEIDTFLNDPKQAEGYEGAVAGVIAALAREVRRLYDAGARKFVVPNLPDLGHTPIVLQNRSYFPRPPTQSEVARKLELSRRLSELTSLHNRLLARSLEELRRELEEIVVVAPDVERLFRLVLENRAPGGAAFEYGFALDRNAKVLGSGARAKRIQDRCYQGGYFGTSGSTAPVCADATRALFWDVVHPTSYTHCWLAWYFHAAMAGAGWLEPALSPAEQRDFCGHAVAVGTPFLEAD